MTDAAEHEHAMRVSDEIVAQTSGGGHTRFYMLICPCGRTELFPFFNYTITTPEFQAGFLARLAVDDCYLVVPLT
jgi:hypothetical protein